ncbi:MAG: serine protease [Elusimicrobia bacterium]|nr:serine protease [Elusimicrobiota bacterium]
MKIKHFVILSAVLLPASFIFMKKAAPVPGDLRDAVADNAYVALHNTGSEASVPEVPAPMATSRSEAKSIYGTDDRLDYYETSAAMKELSNSVVSLWSANAVTIAGNKASLRVTPFGAFARLCPGEKFAEQPMGALCSGTLVGDDIVMTAGHCVTSRVKCAATKFVFGYVLKKAGDYPDSVPAGDVYSCKNIIARDLDTVSDPANGGPGPDFALIKLDRKVTGRRPLRINRNSRPAKGNRLFVIGYPAGLPLKVAHNARVLDASPRYFFKADLDTFGGNSGSAVFNAETKLIEGILVRGGKDFVLTPAGCRINAVAAQTGANGESVTKISVLDEYIP